MHDPVWYRDVRVLFQRPTEFFPSRDQTPEERVNSIVRMIVYASAAVFAYSRKAKYLLLALAAITAVTLAYSTHAGSTRGAKPLYRPAGMTTQGRRPAGGRRKGGGTLSSTNATRGRGSSLSGISRKSLGLGQASGKPSCTWSTPNNPFANVLLTDVADNPDRAPACDYDVMKKDIRHNFNRGLIRDAHDVFEKENSQRQYFSTPVTTTYPDTKSFAEFAYGTKVGCKENPAACTGNF